MSLAPYSLSNTGKLVRSRAVAWLTELSVIAFDVIALDGVFEVGSLVLDCSLVFVQIFILISLSFNTIIFSFLSSFS